MTPAFLFLLFILPFLVNPFGGAFFEPPKVIVAEVVIEMLMVYVLLRHKLHLSRTLLLTAGGLFVLSVVDIFLFPSQTSFFGNQFRLQGTFLLWHLLILATISSQFELNIPKPLHYLLPMRSIGKLCLLPALLLVTVFMGESNSRAIGTLGEANSLGALAVFFWPFAYFGIKTSKLGWLIKSFCFLIALIIIFLAGSRSAMIALVIQAVFILVLTLSRSWKIALATTLILFLSSMILPFLETNQGYKFEDRQEVWKVAAVAGMQSPFIGSGFGNIEQVFKSTAQAINSDLQYQYVDSSHNIFLDFWVQGGLIAVGILGWLIINSIATFTKHKKPLEFVLFIGLLTTLSFNPVSVVILIPFWWLIGQRIISHS